MASESRQLFVQCLPLASNPNTAFYRNQLDVRVDVVSKLKQRGVRVVERPDGNVPVLILFQSTGRIGDELPAALRDLNRDIISRVIIFAAIQDDEYTKVNRGALPDDFQPECLVDFCVVPGTSHLKHGATNDERLRQVALLVTGQVAVRSSDSGQSWKKWCIDCLSCSFCPCFRKSTC